MQNLILSKLEQLECKLDEHNLVQKSVLTFREAARYLDLSESYLYHLTSKKLIPHYRPNGKRLYFNRVELDEWMLGEQQEDQYDEMAQADCLTVKTTNDDEAN